MASAGDRRRLEMRTMRGGRDESEHGRLQRAALFRPTGAFRPVNSAGVIWPSGERFRPCEAAVNLKSMREGASAASDSDATGNNPSKRGGAGARVTAAGRRVFEERKRQKQEEEDSKIAKWAPKWEPGKVSGMRGVIPVRIPYDSPADVRRAKAAAHTANIRVEDYQRTLRRQISTPKTPTKTNTKAHGRITAGKKQSAMG